MVTCNICGDSVLGSEYIEHKRTEHPEKMTVACPTCDGVFQGERGVRRHHKQAHEESISKEEAECSHCGTVFEYYPRVRSGIYCSDECKARGAGLGDNQDGENNTNWKGGHEGIDYGPEWQSVRQNVLERDGYECLVCGSKKSEFGASLDVHHIVPVKRFNSLEKAHRLENLVTLCRSHHIQVEQDSIDCPEVSG
ncbi:HNH endonuclease [Haloarcula virus HCTV-16]|nr:HNH endonuclease [Haloarcula virus HCTV-16]